MKINQFGKNTMYESASHRNRFQDFSEYNLDALIRMSIRKKLFREFLELYGNKHGLEGYILLHAHGGVVNDKWVFTDGKKLYDVQNWINKYDGSCLSIILHCCNPVDHEVHSDISIIIHLNGIYNNRDFFRGAKTRLFVPGEGYLEKNYYKLKKTIDKLK